MFFWCHLQRRQPSSGKGLTESYERVDVSVPEPSTLLAAVLVTASSVTRSLSYSFIRASRDSTCAAE